MTENGFDAIWSHVAHFSRHQASLVLLASFQTFTCGMWLLLPIFTHYTPTFQCDAELLCQTQNCSTTDRHPDCTTKVLSNENDQTQVEESVGIKCTEFIFEFNGTNSINDGQMSTLVSSFSLVCDLAWVAPFMISIKGVGGLLGSFLGSICSDAYGRRLTMLIGSVFQTLLALSMSSMPNWWSYAVCDCLIYALSQALYLAGMVYVCEILGPSKRHLTMVCSILFSAGYVSCPYSLGVCLSGITW